MPGTKKKISKKEFYHQQRLQAEKKGDTAALTSIYDKLNSAKYSKTASNAREKREKALGIPDDDRYNVTANPTKKSKLGGHRGS